MYCIVKHFIVKKRPSDTIHVVVPEYSLNLCRVIFGGRGISLAVLLISWCPFIEGKYAIKYYVKKMFV